MNPHGARKAETDCSRVNDLTDGERAHKPWGQLYLEWEIMCGQPNPLTRSVMGCRGPTAVGICCCEHTQATEAAWTRRMGSGT